MLQRAYGPQANAPRAESKHRNMVKEPIGVEVVHTLRLAPAFFDSPTSAESYNIHPTQPSRTLAALAEASKLPRDFVLLAKLI